MTYDRQILDILTRVGQQGIGVKQLAKHVYNMNCTLFAQPDLQEVHSYVRKYLLRNSKSQLSLIVRTGRRGYYRLNTKNNVDARQLMLQVRKQTRTEEPAQEAVHPDLSLNLFD